MYPQCKGESEMNKCIYRLLCMYVCVYVCMCVCVYLYVYICAYVSLCVYVCMYLNIYLPTYQHTCDNCLFIQSATDQGNDVFNQPGIQPRSLLEINWSKINRIFGMQFRKWHTFGHDANLSHAT